MSRNTKNLSPLASIYDNGEQNQDNNLWEEITKPNFPTLTERERLGLRIQASCDWMFGHNTELGTLYDKDVFFRQLKT